MTEHDHRICSVLAAGLALVALVTVLASCQTAAPPPALHAPRTGEGPVGTGPVQHEPGMDRLCEQQLYQGCR